MESKYKKNIEEQKSDLKELNKKSVIFGNLRLFLAFFAVAFIVLLIIFWFSVLYLFLFILILAGFIFLTVLHSDISSRIKYRKGIIGINEEYLMRISGEWKVFSDNGGEFEDYNHNYSYDLDIFGDKSLFQFINVAKTPFGRTCLKNDLAHPKFSNEDIVNRQDAINELSESDKLSFDFQYYGKQIKYSKELPKVIGCVNEKQEFLKTKSLKYALYPLPFIVIALCAIFFSLGIQSLYIASYALIILQVSVWLGFSFKTFGYLGGTDKIHYSLSDYSQLYKILEAQAFNSKILQKIKSDLTSSEMSAAKATKKLDGIMQMIQLRSGGIMYFLLNIFFLWDIICALRLSAWTKKYGKFIEVWFKSLGEFESLLSFSVPRGVLTTSCKASLSQKKHTFSVKNIGHPLLNNADRVSNDFELNKNINIVSGSNMSGKTTFLRTLGINLLLAKNGSAVCAKEMSFSNTELVTSMRISDDLTDGISTFYSELKKIKQILEIARKSSDVLFLIDEIFKGTNSTDRTAGAKAVVKKLKEYNAYGLLTTHDLNLCEDFESIKINNYNFSESYEGGKLKFDYKIHTGIAKTTNGEYLMKFTGIM